MVLVLVVVAMMMFLNITSFSLKKRKTKYTHVCTHGTSARREANEAKGKECAMCTFRRFAGTKGETANRLQSKISVHKTYQKLEITGLIRKKPETKQQMLRLFFVNVLRTDF